VIAPPMDDRAPDDEDEFGVKPLREDGESPAGRYRKGATLAEEPEAGASDGKGEAVEPRFAHATVRYYRRMALHAAHALRITFVPSLEPPAGTKKLATGGTAFEVEPSIPGCNCFPSSAAVNDGAGKQTIEFRIVPTLAGRMPDAKVLLRHGGVTVSAVPVQMRATRRPLWQVLLALAAFAPLVVVVGDLALRAEPIHPFGVADPIVWLLRGVSAWTSPTLLVLAFVTLAAIAYFRGRSPRSSEHWNLFMRGPHDRLRDVQRLMMTDLAAAGDAMERLLREHPVFQAAWLYDGECQYRLADYEKGLTSFRTALKLGKASARSYVMAARCAAETGDNERAVWILRDGLVAILSGPNRRAMHYNVACCQARLGRTSEALTALEDAVREGYDNVDRLRDDPDLKPLRSLPRFAGVLAEAAAGKSV